MLYPWISRCWGKGGKGKRGKGEKKGKGKSKGEKGESSKDEKDKDKKGKGKGKNNVKTEYSAGYCLQCKGWGHMKKDCWWDENAKSAKDTASPATPAESTKTDTPITGMLMQSDTRRPCTVDLFGNEARICSYRQRFPDRFWSCDIGESAECGRQAGWKTRRAGSGAQVSHGTSVHDDRQHDNLLAHARRCQRGE